MTDPNPTDYGVDPDQGYTDDADGDDKDLVYVYPAMMATQIERYADLLKTLASLAKMAESLTGAKTSVREGGDNGGERGKLLDIVERETILIGMKLMHVRALTTRKDLLSEM